MLKTGLQNGSLSVSSLVLMKHSQPSHWNYVDRSITLAEASVQQIESSPDEHLQIILLADLTTISPALIKITDNF